MFGDDDEDGAGEDAAAEVEAEAAGGNGRDDGGGSLSRFSSFGVVPDSCIFWFEGDCLEDGAAIVDG